MGKRLPDQTENQSRLRISVVIPVHNGERTLAQCLAAICQMERPPDEVIVVDDASTDRTAEIASRFPCRIVRLTENVGAARAKNRGAAVAQGDILFFTDADVVVPPQLLTWLLENYADETVTGVVGLLGTELPYEDFPSQFKNLWMHHTYARLPAYVGLFYTSAASIRRAAFAAEGGFDESYRGASVTEDMDFGQRLLTAGYRIRFDRRLEVQHLKRYGLRELLRTDLERARALTKIWLRNKLAHVPRKHFASVPWYSAASVPLAGLGFLGILVAPFWPQGGGALAILSYAAILALNWPFLSFLGRQRGWRFFLQAALFLPPDLFVSGLGIVAGFWDVMRGRRY